MAEELTRIELDCTYKHSVTVFFYGDRVFAGKKYSPIEQRCEGIKEYDRTYNCLTPRIWRGIISEAKRASGAAEAHEALEHPERRRVDRLRNEETLCQVLSEAAHDPGRMDATV